MVMEPNNPTTQPSGGYDFLKDSGKSRKLPDLSAIKALPFKAKIVLFGGGLFVLFILFIIVSNLFFRAPDNSQQLAAVARQQADILQVAELGVSKARGQAARNLAVTVRLSLIGDQEPLLDALGSRNVRVSTKDDEELEQQFIVAEQGNRFDQEMLDYLQTELASYTRNLEAAFNSTEDPDLRQVLAAQYENAQFLSTEEADE